jgi:hypothetical protein
LDRVGWIDRINRAVDSIARGRIKRTIKGQAEEGLEYFYDGLDNLIQIVREVTVLNDPLLMTLVEYTILAQEREGALPEEVQGRASFEEALREFDDAFRCIPLVDKPEIYKDVEKSYPIRGKYRYQGMPLDAYHVAYISHKTRMNNNRRRIGIDHKELELQDCRDELYVAAQDCYRERQGLALGISENTGVRVC